MMELRIYNSRNWIMARIKLNESGNGRDPVERTGTAEFFRVFKEQNKISIFEGTVGGPDRAGDLQLDTRCMVMGSDEVWIHEMALP